MGVEEQQEEREVLDSIFPDEIADISDTAYRISIKLEVAEAEDEEAEPPVIVLGVQYPPEYPDEAPRLDLSVPPNVPKYKWLDIQMDKGRLLESLQPTIEENLETLIAERQNAVEAEREVELRKAEEEENAKFHGTPVTRETFLAWREKFMAETDEEERRKHEEALAEDKKKKAAKDEIRLTGKQLWERGLVGKGEEDEEGDDGLVGMDKLKIEAA